MKRILDWFKKDFSLTVKAFIIGSSMTVPGVSGGTMAILLGIFDKLIFTLSSFGKDIKNNFLFLLKFCIGATIGLVISFLLVGKLLEAFPIPVSFLFLGAIIGGIPIIAKKTKINAVNILFFILGIAIVVGITYLPQGLFALTAGFSIWNVIICLITGVICSVTLALPGISTSHMLYVLGMYTVVISAIKNLDLLTLFFICVGVLIGFIFVPKPIAYAMKNFPPQSYSVILGFVIGSPLALFDKTIIPAFVDSTKSGENALWWCLTLSAAVLLLITGVFAMLILTNIEEGRETSNEEN